MEMLLYSHTYYPLCDGALSIDATLAAQMEQWISVEYSYFYPEFLPIYFERVLKKMYQPGVGPYEALCEAKTKALVPTLDLLETHLQQTGGPFLIGQFSLADVTFVPYTFQFGPCGLQPLLDSRPSCARRVGGEVPGAVCVGLRGSMPTPAASWSGRH